MAKVPSRRLVIDACIARASGGEGAVHPTSKNCRDFLKAVLEIRHRMVLTEAIAQEWDEHQSGFARRWRVEMFARKIVERIDVPEDESLRHRVARAADDPHIAVILHKDCHLIEAALASDKRIASIETSSRDHFRDVARSVKELPRIGWVNPDDPAEAAIGWLAAGADLRSCRRLIPRDTGS